MEPKTERKRTLKDLLDQIAWRTECNALHEAFIEALEVVGDQDLKTECCMNNVKHIATQNAGIRAKDKTDATELGNLFEEECDKLANDLLGMPGKFRDWLSTQDLKAPRAPKPAVDVVVVMGGDAPECGCPSCTSFREYMRGTHSESPTERPPPPPPAEETAS